MSALLSRALALLALVPVAACDLYLRPDEVADDDVGPVPDGGGLPDAADTDAGVPIDAPIPVDPPNPGFVTPTSTTRANAFRNGQWVDVGPADWSCLNQPPSEPVPAGGYTLTGTVRDYANNSTVGGAGIQATAGGQTLASGTSSNGAGTRGTYRLDLPALPAGITRVRFAVSGMAAHKTIAIDRYLGNINLATLDLPLVSDGTANALLALVGETSDPTEGLVVGEVRDCQGRQVSGAIIALSTSTTLVVHWPGGVTFYFSAAATSLPVRHNVRTETHRDGRFMVVRPTPAMGAEGTLQAWGFPTDADRAAGTLRLLGKSAAVIEASVVSHALIGRQRGALGTP